MVFVSHSARAAGKKNLSAAVIVPPYIHSKGEKRSFSRGFFFWFFSFLKKEKNKNAL